ncbi:MAG TPA: hypothetical protein VLH38_03905 [Patescibacteria group bacterium]|nr:hypothetical protein [Patescibacteria group bacterium]
MHIASTMFIASASDKAAGILGGLVIFGVVVIALALFLTKGQRKP